MRWFRRGRKMIAKQTDFAVQTKTGLEIISMNELRSGLAVLSLICFVLGIIVGIFICTWPT